MFLLLMLGTASAGWKDTFKTSEFVDDLDTAVLRVMAKGVSTTDVFEYAYIDLDLEPKDIFMAMYCAGVKSPEIVRLARLFFIPLSTAIEAYKDSTIKCKIGVA